MLAGKPGDIPQRVSSRHRLFADSGRNHVFPQVALHGAPGRTTSRSAVARGPLRSLVG